MAQKLCPPKNDYTGKLLRASLVSGELEIKQNAEINAHDMKRFQMFSSAEIFYKKYKKQNLTRYSTYSNRCSYSVECLKVQFHIVRAKKKIGN